MPIFISYNHSDATFATRLARQLVRHRAHVWIDKWEMHVGDSLIERIQSAVQGASAMLVILSKASVSSEWCKKELSAALLRELEEKRVIALPVLVEDCEVPLFLRGKLYADFRQDFDAGLRAVLEAVARFTSEDLGRVDTPEWLMDWGEEWGVLEGRAHMHLTILQMPVAQPYTVLTEIDVLADDIASQEYFALEKRGLNWLVRGGIIESIAEYPHREPLRILLEDAYRKSAEFDLGVWSTGGYQVLITSRRLGTNTGRDM